MLLPMAVTLWRVPILVSEYKKSTSIDNLRKIIFYQFMQWLLDLPHLVFLALTAVMAPWRVPTLLRSKQIKPVRFILFIFI